MATKMTPLTKGGTRTAHAGKGSKTVPMPMRHTITQSGATQPGAGVNNYAKATPMPGPAAPSPDGLGSGTWPGIGQ
jgi:hypothetical protein